MRRGALAAVVFVSTATAAAPALAHTGHEASSVFAGLAHPWGGWDHALVMAGVGFAALRSLVGPLDLRVLILPMAFLASMAVGAIAAWSGLGGAWAEWGIVASLVFVAFLGVAGTSAPTPFALAIVAAAGLAHGAAHGAEGIGAAYFSGFLLSTGFLHGLGLFAGVLAMRVPRWRVGRRA